MKRAMRLFPKLAAMLVVAGVSAILFVSWFFLRYPELKRRNMAVNTLNQYLDRQPDGARVPSLEQMINGKSSGLREPTREELTAKYADIPDRPMPPGLRIPTRDEISKESPEVAEALRKLHYPTVDEIINTDPKEREAIRKRFYPTVDEILERKRAAEQGISAPN